MTRVCSNKAVVPSLCVRDTRQLSLACVLSCVQPRGKVGGAVPECRVFRYFRNGRLRAAVCEHLYSERLLWPRRENSVTVDRKKKYAQARGARAAAPRAPSRREFTTTL